MTLQANAFENTSYIYLWEGTHTMACLWRWKAVLPMQVLGLTSGCRIGSRHHSLLSHLVNHNYFFEPFFHLEPISKVPTGLAGTEASCLGCVHVWYRCMISSCIDLRVSCGLWILTQNRGQILELIFVYYTLMYMFLLLWCQH